MVSYMSALSALAVTAILPTYTTAVPLVTLPTGVQVNGNSVGDSVESFLGIQYARVGERFTRSTLMDPTTPTFEMINATNYGPNCHQLYTGLPEWIYLARPESEDCLYLNIWRPTSLAENSTEPLSTMVWIHGGGLALGTGADPVYDGTALAQNQNVLVVTLNYRLGPLGFLPQDASGTGAMNGLYDQILALRWINRYIAHFGGSPDQVTVFGESAGGESICMLSVSPLTKGLFQRAILQSGECINNDWNGGIPNEDIAYGLGLVDNLVAAAGATSLDDLKNATKFPAAELNALSASVGFPLVALDSEILPLHPRELYQDPSNIVPEDFMVGANSFEDINFFGLPPSDYIGLASDLSGWAEGLLGGKYGAQAADLAAAAYDPSVHYDDDTVAAFAQFNGDYYIRCPVRKFASIASEAAIGKVYLYNFAHLAATDPVYFFGLSTAVNISSSWASHMAEIPFVFGTMAAWNFTGADVTEQDLALSVEMQTRWANFAKTGSPNLNVGSDDDTWVSVASDGALSATERVTSTDATSFVFTNGQGSMQSVPEKVEQCAAFPYSTLLPTSAPTSDRSPMPSNALPSSPPPTSGAGAPGLMVGVVLVLAAFSWCNL